MEDHRDEYGRKRDACGVNGAMWNDVCMSSLLRYVTYVSNVCVGCNGRPAIVFFFVLLIESFQKTKAPLHK